MVTESTGLTKRQMAFLAKRVRTSILVNQADFFDCLDANSSMTSSTSVKNYIPAKQVIKESNMAFKPEKEIIKRDILIKKKVIEFQYANRMEEVILQKCNNKRAFYIETIRLFTLLEDQKDVYMHTRWSFCYFWIKGLHTMQARQVTHITELSATNSYETKGFIGDYGGEYMNRKSLISKEKLRAFDVKPYLTMPFDELERQAERRVMKSLVRIASNTTDLKYLRLLEVLHAMDSPPMWFARILEHKITS